MGYYTDFYLQAAPVTEDQFHSIDSALQELRSMREAYQKYPGCKVQFTQAHIDKYLKRVEREDREPKIRRK